LLAKNDGFGFHFFTFLRFSSVCLWYLFGFLWLFFGMWLGCGWYVYGLWLVFVWLFIGSKEPKKDHETCIVKP
ncbi:hypothetical protein, partial [Plebeiibacterium sediminum]